MEDSSPANPTPEDLVKKFCVSFGVADRGFGNALEALADLTQQVRDDGPDAASRAHNALRASTDYFTRTSQAIRRRIAMIEAAQVKLFTMINEKLAGDAGPGSP